MNRFQIPAPGCHLSPEIRKNCYWEIVLKDHQVLLIQRGGPLEPIALEISCESGWPEVTDCWEWGNG